LKFGVYIYILVGNTGSNFVIRERTKPCADVTAGNIALVNEKCWLPSASSLQTIVSRIVSALMWILSSQRWRAHMAWFRLPCLTHFPFWFQSSLICLRSVVGNFNANFNQCSFCMPSN